MKFGAREIIFLALMLALLAGTWVFVFKKSNARRIAMEQEIESRNSALANLATATQGVEDLGRKIDELGRAIKFFEEKLPREKEVEKILEGVSQMAEANSLVAKSVKTIRTDRGANYSEQSLQMTLTGDFNGFYAFMLNLEKLPRITRVTQMNLQKMNDRDGAMTAQITLTVFFEPDQLGRTAVAANN